MTRIRIRISLIITSLSCFVSTLVNGVCVCARARALPVPALNYVICRRRCSRVTPWSRQRQRQRPVRTPTPPQSVFLWFKYIWEHSERHHQVPNKSLRINIFTVRCTLSVMWPPSGLGQRTCSRRHKFTQVCQLTVVRQADWRSDWTK